MRITDQLAEDLENVLATTALTLGLHEPDYEVSLFPMPTPDGALMMALLVFSAPNPLLGQSPIVVTNSVPFDVLWKNEANLVANVAAAMKALENHRLNIVHGGVGPG